ncbi:MAG: outer membrane protein assembly factor BamA, partial [Bacteroidetes bacterium QS_1_63_11]
MRLRLPTLFLVFLLGGAMTAGAQTPTQSSPTSSTSTAASPRATYVIDNIRVEGVEDQQKRQFVEQSSGLARGQEITLPSGDAIAQAIRSVYDLPPVEAGA